MTKRILPQTLAILAVITVTACTKQEQTGAVVGATGIVLLDKFLEDRNGDDGLF